MRTQNTLAWAAMLTALLLDPVSALGVQSPPPAKKSGVFVQAGVASWYRSRRTMSAAHRTLPIGSRLKVTSADGRSIVVTIVGRGPFIKGRVLDLSSDAFKQLVSLRKGLLRVRLELLGRVAHSASVHIRNEVHVRVKR